ncbi:MAG: hypothetical protein QT08_C0004G0006 [archaeon GW2011_AR17]|nr:MAG: hypothetical protein QT08_C0004G0006 [archaeon GW2011_AR17]MBS3154754.1 hypothetical protein [Candidatus Woesearchaeota archaeon]HIH15443.1 hypothetical protein [Nanoarchaeota archaeon]HIH59542.1 hypothetical protein [Nanoarchaeota archaeon]HII13636.1 hypothetical protein [Nanoarchaeota archaeon]
MSLQLFTKWYAKYVLFALCCVILLVVPLLHGPWVGNEALFYFRLAEDPSWYDPLSSGGQFAAYQWGTALVLSAAPEVLIQILPFLLGILSFLLFGKILRSFHEDPIFVHLSMLFLLLSPAFIYTFSFTNSLFIAFFLSLVAFYFFIQKKRKWLSVPILMLIPLFNIILACTSIFLFFFYSFFWKKERRKLFFIGTLCTFLVSAFYYGYILYHTGMPQRLQFDLGGQFLFLQKIFFDFGSPYGLGIFLSLLAIIGIAVSWEKKYSNFFLFFSVFFLLIFSFFRLESLLFLSLFVIFLAAKGFIYLLQVHWNSSQYRNFVLLILLSGLVFSGISQIDALLESSPNDADLEGLSFLAEQKQGVVFTDYTRGVWVSAVGHSTILDENYLFVSDAEERFEDSKTLYYSRDIKVTRELFEKYDISYVWIDSAMKEELWKYDTEGLLFILEYTKDFKKIYDKEGVEIWSIDL